MNKAYQRSLQKWKELFYTLNEEMGQLDVVNQSLLERCLQLEIENGRLTREVQRNNTQQGTPLSGKDIQTEQDGSMPVGDSV